MSVQELPVIGGAPQRASRVQGAIDAASRRLLSLQHADGHWCGELEGDTILESEYLLLLQFLGRAHEARFASGAEYLRRQQLPDGGWAIYAGGPTELSASVKAYFVLKLAGDATDAPHMTRARNAILALGGVERCNSFTKIYLSIFGQYDWAKCPAVPPELILLPDWFVFNIYKMSYWSRCIVVPLSIIWAHKPAVETPCDIRELYVNVEQTLLSVPVPRTDKSVCPTRRERFWRAFFNTTDRVFKLIEALHLTPLRKRALRKATDWIVEHLDHSGGLGAIFPPIVNTVFAFRALGHPAEHPVIAGQLRELERLEIEEDGALRLQPCFSAVWDTALAVHILASTGTPPDDPRLLAGARWLLRKQTTIDGDWKRNNPNGSGGGWFFQYDNAFYPDTDDTSEVLLALDAVRFPDAREERARRNALERAIRWQRSMQNRDGGWGAFDRECNNDVFTFIPFADHNAMIDPSCEDITGRTLEALIALGFAQDEPAVRNAIRFLRDKQDFTGTWYGRWGCNYIYGTFLAARGLAAAEHPIGFERMTRWLGERQNADGGWGELQASYDDPSRKGIGPSTPSQTAWALLALFAAGDYESDAVQRGVDYLLHTQRDDGAWRDETWTATGFPKVFYLRYHLYATYFPLWALGEYAITR
jgi:squalene-hopene/tetraprenyl-beta-curcumene cyclase